MKLAKKEPIHSAVEGLVKKFEAGYKNRLLIMMLRANIGPQGLPEPLLQHCIGPLDAFSDQLVIKGPELVDAKASLQKLMK